MGAWGVEMRESDYGLDLLDLVIDALFTEIDFKYFYVAGAIKLLRQIILDETKNADPGCPPEELDLYIGENFQKDFGQAVMLAAECLVDYYQYGELAICDFSSGNTGQPVRQSRKSS